MLSNFGSDIFSQRQRDIYRALCKLENKNLKLKFWDLKKWNFGLKIENWKKCFEILIFHDGMFAAWNEKPKKPNMSSQNVISLPSIGHFVGDLAQKRQKDSLLKMLVSLAAKNILLGNFFFLVSNTSRHKKKLSRVSQPTFPNDDRPNPYVCGCICGFC